MLYATGIYDIVQRLLGYGSDLISLAGELNVRGCRITQLLYIFPVRKHNRNSVFKKAIVLYFDIKPAIIQGQYFAYFSYPSIAGCRFALLVPEGKNDSISLFDLRLVFDCKLKGRDFLLFYLWLSSRNSN